jgi:hypothetical protein
MNAMVRFGFIFSENTPNFPPFAIERARTVHFFRVVLTEINMY